MCRQLVLSCLLTFSLSAVAQANDPRVDPIHQQIKALREEEKITIQHIREHYKAIIGNKKMDERHKERLRKTLLEEERLALSHARGEEHREKIRAHYHYLRRVLSGEIRLDDKTIRRLRDQEGEHIRHIEAVYNHKIRELEESIKGIGHVKPAGKPRKK